MIGDDVSVTVVEVTGQTVRLGIAGPAEVPVYREEIWLAVQAENQAAAESAANALPTKVPAAGHGRDRSPSPKGPAKDCDNP